MQAVKLVSPHTMELQDVPVPEIGPDEILVKIAGAGLCHSDLHVLHMGEEWPFFGGTVGHEGAGWVEKVGSALEGYSKGDAVLVSLIWACGHCRACIEGRDNECEVNGSRMQFPTTPGLGPDGAMAEYLVVKARHLDKIGDLDPVQAAPLADAGVTPMHAINSARSRLTPGSTAVVIGVGGLGHLGLQILKATTGARIIALDSDDSKLELARELGADLVLKSDGAAAQRILDETNQYGADAVFDFVGIQPTVDLAVAVIAPGGMLRFVGLGGAQFDYAVGAAPVLPWGTDVQLSYGGTRADQLQVIALAQQGKLGVEVTKYPLADFQKAFDDLEAGRITGRAVLIP
ncbi:MULTISPECIES: NAD(P)-dependent alcohol dehydrogenase [unclassified Salinibacterium]|uniref:NAD(P)-dependent alcohol dehydrogenase n=1 Tax=unclassified Salinibacterium TaxID=2632331 RepID=UPI0018CDB143|nr:MULTISPECIES: NAD(P)-dependent alcohol dehydrogenase [unclassified Salinibacterium]MBH0052741.1 NAD(P)-dependent alcohol dehydrogenase [Salinibacterium sp. SWN139]MBH0082003.1 NAD(P)-dependent alcohol dehydrogenase [Salinibacterium sp. SWN167]